MTPRLLRYRPLPRPFRRLCALMLACTIATATTPLAAAQSTGAEAQATAASEPTATTGTREASGATDVLRAYVEKLPIGAPVKVTPKQGKTVKGILMLVEHDAIVVKPRTRIPRPEQRLALADIDFVELQTRNGGSSTVKAVGIGVASAVGAFLALILVTVAVIDD